MIRNKLSAGQIFWQIIKEHQRRSNIGDEEFALAIRMDVDEFREMRSRKELPDESMIEEIIKIILERSPGRASEIDNLLQNEIEKRKQYNVSCCTTYAKSNLIVGDFK